MITKKEKAWLSIGILLSQIDLPMLKYHMDDDLPYLEITDRLQMLLDSMDEPEEAKFFEMLHEKVVKGFEVGKYVQ